MTDDLTYIHEVFSASLSWAEHCAGVLDNPSIEYVTLDHGIPETFYTKDKERDKPRLTRAIQALIDSGETMLRISTFMYPHTMSHITFKSFRKDESFYDAMTKILGTQDEPKEKTAVMEETSDRQAASPAITLKLADFGGPVLVASPGSKKLFGTIVDALIFKQNDVVLDFEGVERLTAAYLNEAVGQLYRVMSKEFLKEHMRPPIHAKPMHLTLLKAVVDNAKHTFRPHEKSQKQPDKTAEALASIGVPRTPEERDKLAEDIRIAQMRARNQFF